MMSVSSQSQASSLGGERRVHHINIVVYLDYCLIRTMDFQLDSCICRRCRDDVCELSESGFIPRWRKKSSPHKHCCVPGLLSNTNDGFLSFVQLVGCAYFKKHKSAFLPIYPTPMSLFNSVSKDNPIIKHSTWLKLF